MINFNKFCDILMEIMDKIGPTVKVCVSAKRQYVEPWMKRGLELSSRKNRQLYKASLQPGHSYQKIR